eukprot:gene4087-14187_t
MLRVSSCHQGSRGLSTPAAARFSPHAIRALNSSKNYVSSRSMGIDLKSHLNCPPVIFSPRQPLRTRTNGWPFGDGDKNTDQRLVISVGPASPARSGLALPLGCVPGRYAKIGALETVLTRPMTVVCLFAIAAR